MYPFHIDWTVSRIELPVDKKVNNFCKQIKVAKNSSFTFEVSGANAQVVARHFPIYWPCPPPPFCTTFIVQLPKPKVEC